KQSFSGLFVGEAGVCLAILRAGQVLNDTNIIESSSRQFYEVSSAPLISPDIYGGAAGKLKTSLNFWAATGDEAYLNSAITIGDWLSSTVKDTSNGHICWEMPLGHGDLSGRRYTGYAHGAAGIADALLDLFEMTGEERFL